MSNFKLVLKYDLGESFSECLGEIMSSSWVRLPDYWQRPVIFETEWNCEQIIDVNIQMKHELFNKVFQWNFSYLTLLVIFII